MEPPFVKISEGEFEQRPGAGEYRDENGKPLTGIYIKCGKLGKLEKNYIYQRKCHVGVHVRESRKHWH